MVHGADIDCNTFARTNDHDQTSELFVVIIKNIFTRTYYSALHTEFYYVASMRKVFTPDGTANDYLRA